MARNGALASRPLRAVQIGDEIGCESARHVDFTVGKVDHEQNAVDQGIAESDECIDAALGQAGHYQADPLGPLCTCPT